MAGASPLKAVEYVEVDAGDIVTDYTTGTFGLSIRPQYKVYFGCVPAGNYYWGVLGFNNAQWNVPDEVTGIRKGTYNVPSNNGATGAVYLGVQGPFTSEWRDFEVVDSYAEATLVQNSQWNPVDTHRVHFRVRGRIRHGTGGVGNNHIIGSPTVVLSLKPGGLAAGMARVPQLPGSGGPSEPDPDELNVGTYVPKWATDANGQSYEVKGPAYTLPGGQTGTWPTGTNWGNVKVPGGGTGVPSWFASGFPGSVSITDNNGGKWLIGGQMPGIGGGVRDGGFTSGSVTVLPDGGVRVSAWGSSGPGWSTDWSYPPGYSPKKIDGLPAEEPDPMDAPVDPCFHGAYTDATGNPPPDGNPPPTGPGDPVPPPGMQKGIPSLPGGGGGGGGSGSGPTASLPGYVPPTGAPTPNNPGDTGETPQPGEPLPEDSQPSSDAKKMAEDYLDNVGEVQESAEGLMGWATLEQFNPGIAGDWVVSLSISGQSFAMVIPTTHAPLIRAMLLLLLRVTFVVAVFRLLLS